MIRILSLNVGLLDFLFGRIRPTPFVEERLKALPQALIELDADIVALQEIYSDRHCRWLQAAVAKHFPYVGRVSAGALSGLANGLLVLSRYPLEARLTLFDSAPIDEWLFDHKGVLRTEISLPSGRLILYNLHTTAGGLFHHPEHINSDRHRQRQLIQVFELAAHDKDALVLIVGDVNAGPGVSDGNYRLFEENNYLDLHHLANAGVEEATWEPNNPLNFNGPHRTSPPQRIDHVFARAEDIRLKRFVPSSSRIVLREARVGVSDGSRVCVSDHFGVMTHIALGQVMPVLEDSAINDTQTR